MPDALTELRDSDPPAPAPTEKTTPPPISPADVAPPVAKDAAKSSLWDFTKKTTIAAALAATGLGVPAAIIASAMSGAPAAVEIIDRVGTESPVSDTLGILRANRLDQPPTDLGSDIQEAFTRNPELRDRLLRDVRNTLGTSND